MQFWAVVLVLVIMMPKLGLAQNLPSDTGLSLQTLSSRPGINTFALKNTLLYGQKFRKVNALYVLASQDWVYNTAFKGASRFVTRNLILQTGAQRQNKYNITSGLHAWLYDYATNFTRLAGSHINLGHIYNKNNFNYFQTHQIGLQYDKRGIFEDAGLSFQSEVLGSYTPADSSAKPQLVLRLRTGNVWIKPRTNANHAILASYNQTFAPGAQAQAQLGYRYRRIEDYLGQNIQSIVSDTLIGALKLSYDFGKYWSVVSDNSWQRPNRSFDYRPNPKQPTNAQQKQVDYNQDEIFLSQQLRYSGQGRLDAMINYSFQQRIRLYDVGKISSPERIKDIIERTITWTTQSRLRLSRKHALSAISTAQLYRADTPSLLNNQDRDELLYMLQFSQESFWNSSFSTMITIAGSFRHFIFINGSQSIENFKERILRYEPGFRLTIGPCIWIGQNGLWVSYNVRDYAGQETKNRANRSLALDNLVQWQISRSYQASTQWVRRENRTSVLNWNSFSESPLDTVVVSDVMCKVQKQLVYGSADNIAKIWLGYRFFRQTRKSRSGLQTQTGNQLIYLRNFIVQHGPVLGLRLLHSPSLEAEADCWVQVSTNKLGYRPGVGNYFSQLTTTEQLNAVSKRFFPFFNIRLNWRPRLKW